MIKQGDCIEHMKQLEENSVDAIVTDPPYGLEFMGKDWDKGVPGIPFWEEMIRVLKPGGFLLSFGGTRTYHRMACAIEDAGFEIRDCIQWLYGSGFPKSLNIGKQIDKRPHQDIKFKKWLRNYIEKSPKTIKQLIKECGFDFSHYYRTDIRRQETYPPRSRYIILKKVLLLSDDYDYIVENNCEERGYKYKQLREESSNKILKISGNILNDNPISNEAKEWEGWGTALKPANEPIVVARKPLSEKNVALNVLKWGTGGINIDACRIECDLVKEDLSRGRKVNETTASNSIYKSGLKTQHNQPDQQGRFPANIILDEEAGKMLDEQSGIKNSTRHMSYKRSGGEFIDSIPNQEEKSWFKSEKGGASRFFYCAKASKGERNRGMESFINMEVFELVCEEKGLTKEERLTHLLVDMDTLLEKDIGEFIIKDDLGWNTMLFGKKTMEKYQKDFMFITGMKTDSTILLKTYDWLMHLLTKEYTLDANSLKECGGNHAENVEKSKELIITINEKLASALGVKGVVSGMQLKIKLKEGKNLHPTVKSLSIMEYLIKLVTKEGAIVLDPFLGSGTTAIACEKLGRKWIGIEKEEEYVKIAEARIKPYLEQSTL